jgi:hypothetical protein
MVVLASKHALAILKGWLGPGSELSSHNQHNGRSQRSSPSLSQGNLSYLPTSLLPTVSKGFEKLLPMVENNRLIPNHLFSFRQKHSTIEQTHRIVWLNEEALENKQYCSAASLDICQAFNKVWHPGLLHKLRLFLPLKYFLVIKSYLHGRHFLVKAETEYTELSSVNVDAPQSTQGPLLYLLYTAVLATGCVSQKLQTNLAKIQYW